MKQFSVEYAYGVPMDSTKGYGHEMPVEKHIIEAKTFLGAMAACEEFTNFNMEYLRKVEYIGEVL